jgi:hypothetical protein
MWLTRKNFSTNNASEALHIRLIQVGDSWGVFETPIRCREPAEVAFAGESNKRERICDHVPVLKSHTTSAGDVKRTNKYQHGRQEDTFLARSGTGSRIRRCGRVSKDTIPVIRNHGTCSRILGPFILNAEEQGLEYTPGLFLLCNLS